MGVLPGTTDQSSTSSLPSASGVTVLQGGSSGFSSVPYLKARLSGPSPIGNGSRSSAPMAGNGVVDAAMDGGDGGRRNRKSMMRKTVDYNSSFLRLVERRVWQRDQRDRRTLHADVMHYPELVPPQGIPENPVNVVTTHFVKTATNKMRCPIFTLAWTPEGRRLITGASSGEFTLWNGLTFNFETILQAHDSPVRTMKWSHNDTWMVTGDHGGYIKYWQSNMNNVKMFQAHKEPVRSVSFSPTDAKFASCSDDGTVRVWDFFTCREERVMRGHGADVKCVDWHPTKGIVVSGSKDNQQPVKIWEPKTGAVLATLHAHKSTVMDVRWNSNGRWLLTASRDHLIKMFDVRQTKREVQTFRGHKREASTLSWHPVHEGVFASGGSDGSIMFWMVGSDKEVGAIEQAHDSIVWSLDWHPVGHILCSGSNDHACKYWTRNRPGDSMRDKYNLNTLPYGQTEPEEVSTSSAGEITGLRPIPGMAPEDRVDTDARGGVAAAIPGLNPQNNHELTSNKTSGGFNQTMHNKRAPYTKPIPENFQASWNHSSETLGPSGYVVPPAPPPSMLNDLDRSDCITLQELQRQATAVVALGNVYPILPGSNLFMSVMMGEVAVKDVLHNEFISN